MFFDRFRFEIQTVSIDSHGPIDVQQDTPSRGQNSRPFRIAISRSPRPRASSLYLRVLTVIRFWANYSQPTTSECWTWVPSHGGHSCQWRESTPDWLQTLS